MLRWRFVPDGDPLAEEAAAAAAADDEAEPEVQDEAVLRVTVTHPETGLCKGAVRAEE